jgi:hypothetical protein
MADTTPPEALAGSDAKPRSSIRASKAPKGTKRAAKQEGAKGKPWTFPKHTLEEAIQVAKAIEEKNAGNPMRADILVKAVGYQQPTDWRFLDLLKAANMYGLVAGSGGTATVSLEKIGQDVVAPSSPQQRRQALLKAFRNVEEFSRVDDFYKGKRIPEDEYFINTLTREFNIPRDRADKFVEVFTRNLQFLRAFDAQSSAEARPTTAEVEAGVPPDEGLVRTTSRPTEPRIRQFLDTCFVMMPFGPWYDRYYQEIYVPAIRDAGFEPIRADELFSTGSVVEQIWEQIEKSKVLLAELTDKNANVFYELGLAHAAHKPVVFAAGRVEDGPFDLRHLRVIVYDVREPQWADKLKRLITDYLRNAAKDPARSIPHPFRAQAPLTEPPSDP